MKTLIVTFVIAFMSLSLSAQKRSDLTGPAYKNYKPWLHDNEPATVYSVAKKENLTGPKRKNQKPWENKSDKVYTSINFGSDRNKLTGPAFKNYKPWRQDKSES